MNWRIVVLLAVLAVAFAIVFLLPPIPQSQAYHNFADQRAFFGAPNCFDVISNAPFLLVGVWGIVAVLTMNRPWVHTSSTVSSVGLTSLSFVASRLLLSVPLITIRIPPTIVSFGTAFR